MKIHTYNVIDSWYRATCPHNLDLLNMHFIEGRTDVRTEGGGGGKLSSTDYSSSNAVKRGKY